MASIGAVAEAHRGETTGFDYLRLGLALGVVAMHCLGWDAVWIQRILAARPVLFTILPGFFALSGFLVIGSLFRNSLPEFIALRAIRLVPALAFEITLSALLLGPLFTSLSLSDYFSSPQFFAYFLNVIGEVHIFLPGVFSGDPVNAQLWTLPYELKCYAILVGLALITLLPIRRFFPHALLAAAICLTLWACVVPQAGSAFHPLGRTLAIAFLWGCAIYLFRDRIPHHAVMAVAALVAAEAMLASSRLEGAATLPIAYIVAYIGVMKLPPIGFGDLSYGIFLFHYPVMQALRFGPAIADPLALLAITILLSAVCALASWNLVEQPVLRRKRAIIARMNRTIGFFGGARERLRIREREAGGADTPIADRPST